MHAHTQCCERQAQHASFVVWLVLVAAAQLCRTASPCACIAVKVRFPSTNHTNTWLIQGATGNFAYLFDLSFGETEQLSEWMDENWTDRRTIRQMGRTAILCSQVHQV